ncbi:MAG: serine hydrolase domain-containing protein [Bacteroidota bacterium]
MRVLTAILICGLFMGVSDGIGQSMTGRAKSKTTLNAIFSEASDISSIRSVHIIQEGEVIGKRYFRGATPDWPINIKSASKSITSLLVGIAIDEGYLDSVKQPIGPFFDSYFEAHPDSLKAQITIQDLLTMRAGLETTSFHNYGRWVISKDWVEYILAQPMVKQPGSDMIYSTGSTHLLSVILTKATGMSTRNFAQQYLFDPLQIQVGGWDRDPQGFYMGGNNLALKAGDLIKIGRLVMNGGIYQGQRIVSDSWLEQSFKRYTRSNFNPYDYGYSWWIKKVNGYEMRFAWGYGGQYLFMIPELDSIIVITSSLKNATQARSYKAPIFELLRTQIIPLLEAEQDSPTVKS